MHFAFKRNFSVHFWAIVVFTVATERDESWVPQSEVSTGQSTVCQCGLPLNTCIWPIFATHSCDQAASTGWYSCKRALVHVHLLACNRKSEKLTNIPVSL